MLAGKAHQQEGWEAMECELLAKETFSLMEQLREEGAQDPEQAAWLDELKNDPLYQTLNAAASPEAKADPSPSTPDAAAPSPASTAVTIVDRPANTDQPDLGVAPAVVGPMPEAEQNHWVALQPYLNDNYAIEILCQAAYESFKLVDDLAKRLGYGSDAHFRIGLWGSNILYSEVHSTKFEQYVKSKYRNAEIFRTDLENIDFAIDFALKHAELRSSRA